MAQSSCPVSLKADAFRITRLTAAGAIVAGAGGMMESDSLVTLTVSPEIEEGEDLTTKNAAGGNCTTYKDDDLYKWLNLELTVCGPDPELHELLLGGDLILLDDEEDPDDGDAIGWAMPEEGDENDADPVSIEVWTKAIIGGLPHATRPYIHWVFPYTKNWKLGDRSFQNALLEVTFTGGRAFENANWGNGPTNDWLYTSNRRVQYAQVAASDLPTPVCGIQAIPAQT